MNPLQWMLDSVREFGAPTVLAILAAYWLYQYFTAYSKVRTKKMELENELFKENIEALRDVRTRVIPPQSTNLDVALSRLSDGVKAIGEAVNLIRDEQKNIRDEQHVMSVRLTAVEALLSHRGEI